MITTLRRLDDLERYWGFTWPGWAGIASGCVILYFAVRFSPLSFRPTVTITLFVCTLVGMIMYGVSGQALSPSRQLWAVAAYMASPKLVALGAKPGRRGLVLVSLPDRDGPLGRVHLRAGAVFDLDGVTRGRRDGRIECDVDPYHPDHRGWDPDRNDFDLDAVDVDEVEAARVAVDGVAPDDSIADECDPCSAEPAVGNEQASSLEQR